MPLTDHGRAFVISRLARCETLEELKRAWVDLSDGARADVSVVRFKDWMKHKLGGGDAAPAPPDDDEGVVE
jgi:hypothetical protein